MIISPCGVRGRAASTLNGGRRFGSNRVAPRVDGEWPESAQLSHGLPVFGMRTVAPFAAVLCPLVKWPKSGGSQQGQPSHWVDARFRYVGTEL